MREGLDKAWMEALEGAEAWQKPADPEPVLEALALALVLDLTGDRRARGSSERQRLRERGRQALRATRERALAHPDEREDAQRAIAIAEAGLASLEGDRGAGAPPGDPLCPSPDRMVRMLEGRMDGLSAGACAAHVMRCLRCRGALDVLDRTAQRDAAADAPMAVAAADAASMRPPADGRLVATLQSPQLEAVVFDDDVRRVAVYAARSAPLHVTAQGAVTEEMRPGYWLGRLEASAGDALDARVHLGDEEIDWRIPLTMG